MSLFCNTCGTEFKNGEKFCSKCGAAAPAASAPVNVNYAQAAISSFDGGVLETFVASLVASIITTITCGIGTPWAVCYMVNFIFSHVTIDGKRLRFDGKGGELFGQYIVWAILTVITCGIYGFWVVPKMYNWIAKHTHFAN